MNNNKLIVSILLLVLAGCNGDGYSGSDTKLTGVFLDSAVTNIGYRTESIEGVTDELGQYQYEEGENVTFFIGDLVFPTAPATGVITPEDLAASLTDSTAAFTNMIRLLQSLDQDGNPDNGITITEAAKLSASALNFDVAVSEFEQSSSVINLVSNGGQDAVVTELISTTDAILHFEISNNIDPQDGYILDSIPGTWVLIGEITETLIFYPNRYYEHSSGEVGTYSYADGVLNITSHITNNGSGGFDNPDVELTGPYPDDIGVSFSCNANSTTIRLTTVSGSVDFVRADLVRQLVGSWEPTNSNGESLTFYRNNYYQHSSGEIGIFTYSANTLNIIQHISNPGEGGFDNENADGPYSGDIQVGFPEGVGNMTLTIGTETISYSRTAYGSCPAS